MTASETFFPPNLSGLAASASAIIKPARWIVALTVALTALRTMSAEPGPSAPERKSSTASAAMERYRAYWNGPASLDRNNEFFTVFKYTHLRGFAPEAGVSRRDPSTIIRIGDTYFVWYTKYQGPPPVGSARAEQVTETVPMFDWDLAAIAYATSKDGFEWKEQGLAVTRGPKGSYDDRSVYTPEIMTAGGKYYLFYQCTAGRYVRRQFESIALAWSGSPRGPWTKLPKPVLEPTRSGQWDGLADDRRKVKAPCEFDSQCVHDPCLLVRGGKCWLYYKGEPMGYKGPNDATGVMWGVAIAERPEGPYVRHPLNPVTNSGHEVCVWPYREGVAALCAWDGPEKNTIQYAPDGLNFTVKANVEVPPHAAGAYRPDAYSNTTNGVGITWGLCHIPNYVTPEPYLSFIIRFDCDLSREARRPGMKVHQQPGEQTYFQWGFRMSPDDGPLLPAKGQKP